MAARSHLTDQPLPVPTAADRGGGAEASAPSRPGPPLPRSVERAVTLAVLLAALRCTAQYVLLPFILPWVGLAATVPPWATLALGVLALGSLARAVRQLWRLRHAHRWSYLLLGLVVTAALLLFIAVDLRALLH
ncbi:MAG: hypothetical protein M3Q65_04715 [Chloroflexota bacterium]|nr:hypothetical protein [Chloroflexota bacterium]